MNPIKISKKAFTLLEVVVCIALLAIFASVSIWRGNHLLQHFLLRSSAKTIAQEINTARLLAWSYHADVHLQLKQKGQKILLEWQTDEPLILKHRPSHKIRGVKNILIDGKLCKNATIASFSAISASSCSKIDLQGMGDEGCRVVLQQGRIVAIQNQTID